MYELEIYTSVAKGFKLKVRKFLGLNVEVSGEKLVAHPHPPSWIGLKKVSESRYRHKWAVHDALGQKR